MFYLGGVPYKTFPKNLIPRQTLSQQNLSQQSLAVYRDACSPGVPRTCFILNGEPLFPLKTLALWQT